MVIKKIDFKFREKVIDKKAFKIIVSVVGHVVRLQFYRKRRHDTDGSTRGITPKQADLFAKALIKAAKEANRGRTE